MSQIAPYSLAAVFNRTNSSQAGMSDQAERSLELKHLPLPSRLKPGELLARVKCCTLCGSDFATLAGKRVEPAPCVLGHEIVGEVALLPSTAIVDLRGRSVQVGDRVVWSVAANCDECRNCKRGYPQKCETLRKYGHSRLQPDWQLSGGLAEFCHLVRGTKLLVVNEPIADEVLCPASCATATVAAALRSSGELHSARVLIFGAGLLGLTASAMCRSAGAQSITVCDLSTSRLRLASRFGATATLRWDQSLPDDQQFAQAESAAKFDVVLEMSGSLAAMQAAVQRADIGAKVVLVGAVHPTEKLSLDPESLVRRLITIHGVHNYQPADLLTAVDFLLASSDVFPFSEIVQQRFPLAEVQRATEPSVQATSVRIAIVP